MYRLYNFYGFLYDRDLVFDEMYMIYFNIVKNVIFKLKEDEVNVVDWVKVDECLNDFLWIIEFKSLCILRGIEKCFGYWKVDDLNKFVFLVFEIVFNGFFL